MSNRYLRMAVCLSIARSYLESAKYCGKDTELSIESARKQIAKYYRLKAGELV